MKIRKPSLVILTTNRVSKKVRKASSDENAVKAVVECLTKLENVNDARTAVSSALQPKSASASRILEVAITEYCFVKDIFFSRSWGNLHELRTGSALHRNVKLVLADPRTALTVRGFEPALLTMRTSKRTSTML